MPREAISFGSVYDADKKVFGDGSGMTVLMEKWVKKKGYATRLLANALKLEKFGA